MDVKTEIEKWYGKSIPEHATNLDTWMNWYKGYDPKFHPYKIPQGRGKTINVTRLSMKMGKAACENYANLLVNEKTNIVLSNENDNNLFQKVLERLGFWNRTNAGVEKDYALGSGAGVISLDYNINENTGEIIDDGNWDIHYEFLDAYKVFPLEWKYGECVECAFASFGTTEGTIVLHVLDDKNNYLIKTYLYSRKTTKDNWVLATGQENPRIVETNSPIKLFSYLKPNISNNEDLGDDTGISIYANAIDTMKSIDTVYDGYHFEFILGKKRAFVSSKLLIINEKGEPVNTFDENDMGIYVMPEDDSGKENFYFEEGQLRAEAYSKALNDYLSMFSYQCGFGKGFFSFGGEGGRPLQTATAVMMQNNDLFRNIKKQEIFIDKFLTEMTQAIIFASTKWTQDKFTNIYDDIDIKISFDDSVFEDKETEKETDRKDVQLGTMSKVEYRAKWFAEDEDAAKSKLNENADYLSSQINALLPALQAKVISPELFVKLIFGENFTNAKELVNYITENIDKASFSPEELLSGGFGTNP